MDLTLFDDLKGYLERNGLSMSVTLGIILLYIVLRTILFRLIHNRANKHKIDLAREVYIRKLSHIMLVLMMVTILGAAWEISFKGLSIYFASIFTVVGVGLFATWSILSNLTASIILFFFFPYRIGEKVRIIDGDNSVEGKIVDITLFYIKIEADDGKIFSYPNNLAIQKPFMQTETPA